MMQFGEMASVLVGKPVLEKMEPGKAEGFKEAMRFSLQAQITMLVVQGVSLSEVTEMLNEGMTAAATTAQMLGRK